MLKELLLCVSAVSMSAMPSRQANARSHVVEQDGMAITYKYETNEVTYISDLVEGNIFHLSLQYYSNDLQLSSNEYLNFLWVNGRIETCFVDEMFNDDNVVPIEKDYFLCLTNEGVSIQGFMDYTYIYKLDNVTCELDVVLIDHYTNTDLNISSYLSPSTYNEVESVERVYPDNIFGYVSEFIDEHILEGIPNIDNVSYTIGGQNITMRSWLNTSICVVLAVLLISLLIFFVRYIFRLFASLLH